MQKLLNFKARIITAALTFLVLSLVILSYVSFLHLSDVAKSGVNDFSMLRLESSAAQTSGFIQRIKRDIESTADLFVNKRSDQEVMPILINVRKLSDATAVVVGYEDGTALNSNKGRYDASAYDPTQRSWYLKAKNKRGTVITDIYQGASGPLMVSIATPFYTNGKIDGVLLADIELTALSSIVEKSVFKGAAVGLYDNNGIVIAVSGNVGGQGGANVVAGQSRLSDSMDLKQLESEMLTKQKGIIEYSLHGTDEVAFFQAVSLDAEMTWHLLISLDKSTVYKVLGESLTSSVITTSILVIISAILITLVLAQAYRPVLALKRTVEELSSGHGDLTKRLPVTSNDDLGQISQNINIFVENLQQMMLELSSSSDHIGNSIKGLQDLTKKNASVIHEHMSETDQVVTALDEMSATSSDVARNTVEAVEFTTKTSAQTSNSKVVVTGATETVGDLVKHVEEASSYINQMGDEIAEITNVLKVIGEIADQTNLLALNAAIEAARAGEQGRGFAVVADEVRALASRTQQSTAEIQDTIARLTNSSATVINTMQSTKSSCEEASAQTSLVVTDLDSISDSVEGINSLNVQIATAAEEQSLVAEEISRNMSKIREMVEEVAESGVKTDNEAANLAEANTHLTSIVGRFKLQ